jgi:hypothetical protein
MVLAFLGTLVALSYAVYPLSPNVRWTLYVYVLVVVAWIVTGIAYRHAAWAPPLRRRGEEEGGTAGELSSLVATLKRADRGLRFSQAMVILRVRHVFLEKLKARLDLDEEDVAQILANPPKLREVVRDPLILEFLEDTSGEHDLFAALESEGRAPSFRFRRGSTFSRGLARVLEVMEAWD